jgi:hypothetical protein
MVILVININLSTFIIYKNDSSIINIKSVDITFIFFKNYYYYYYFLLLFFLSLV